MHYFNLQNKWFIGPLFLLLFIYIILRALLVAPVLDEIATIYNYVESEDVFGGSAILDANNHVLNSYCAKLMHTFFGDHFFGYRILAILAFPVYFFSSKQIVQKSITTNWNVVVFIAMVTVPWINDYFSMCRGYGASLAFLALALCLFRQWKNTLNARTYLFFTVTLILTIASNLSLLIPVIILFFYGILPLCISVRSRGVLLLGLSSALLFVGFMIPTSIYILKLKKAGALWWGSREGLWEITGKSLTKLTLFSTHDLWKYALLAVFMIISILLIKKFVRTKPKDFIFSEPVWITVLFGGSLLAMLMMDKLLRVNYPMDRVGMYLVPLFFLCVGIHFATNRFLKWVLLLFIWFPISFLLHLNFETTLFSPDDRIEADFYNAVERMTKNKSVSGEYVMQLVYSYSVRKESQQNTIVLYTDDPLTLGDYHLSWQGVQPAKNYFPVLRSKNSKTILYKRKQPYLRKLLLDTILETKTSKNINIPLLQYTSSDSDVLLQAEISGTTILKSPSCKIDLLIGFGSTDATTSIMDQTRFPWYFGSKDNYAFNVRSRIFETSMHQNTLVLQFSNPKKELICMKNTRIKLFAVENPK